MAAPNQDSPICAYILDGQAAGAMSDVDTWKPEAGLLWLHLDHTSPKSPHLRRYLAPPRDVGGIPGAGTGGAFWIVVILPALLAAGEIWLFRRLKWI